MLNRQCNIRLSENLLMQLQDCADLEQLSVSEYIRLKMQGVVVRNRRKHIKAVSNKNATVRNSYSGNNGLGLGGVDHHTWGVES